MHHSSFRQATGCREPAEEVDKLDKLDKLDRSPGGTYRLVIALGVLGLLALSVRFTMDVGKYRDVTWILLAFFAFRVVLGYRRSR